MRLIAAVLAVLVVLISPVTAVAGAMQFPTETAAKAHCPKGTVVWLNLSTAVYHFAGQRWYGRTKEGAYVCKGEADADGDRPTKNGQ